MIKEFIHFGFDAHVRYDKWRDEKNPAEIDDRPLGEIAVDAMTWLGRLEETERQEAIKLGSVAVPATAMSPETKVDAIETDDANFDKDELAA